MKTLSRLSNKHPLLSVICGSLVCVLLLCLAHQWDQDDSAALYWRMAQQKGST